jgi:D-3-phosphoglycerate dehydrogenase
VSKHFSGNKEKQMAKIVFVDTHISGHTEHHLKMKERFTREGHELFLETCKTKAEVLEKAAEAAVIITTYFPIDAEIIEKIPTLRLIIRNAIGYEILDIATATKRNIPVCNIPDYSTEEVATHAFALLLACERKLKLGDRLVAGGDWKIRLGYPIHRMNVQTLGLIGLGRIARYVVKYAKAFGMKIVAYDPYCPDSVFAECGVIKVDLDELLAESDVISLHAPLTEENRHIVNKDSIAKMKDGVIIVNTARGPLISTADLVAGIKSGKILAAGLDVLDEEPLKDATAEILKCESVIVTPHIGYDSIESVADNYDKAFKTVRDVLKGELPYNVLNKKDLK